MNPVTEIRKILAAPAQQMIGEIVALTADVARVRTPAGIQEAKVADSAVYVLGDNVLLRGGVIVTRVSNEQTIPVFTV